MLILSENQSYPFYIDCHTSHNTGSNTFFYNQKKYRIERMTSQEVGVNPKALISMNHLNIQKMSEREFSI